MKLGIHNLKFVESQNRIVGLTSRKCVSLLRIFHGSTWIPPKPTTYVSRMHEQYPWMMALFMSSVDDPSHPQVIRRFSLDVA
jgi:hypothetical protein